MIRVLAVAGCALMLQACMMDVAVKALDDTTSYMVKKLDRLNNRERETEDANTTIVTSSVHCYKTWSQVDCYEQEQAGQAGRYMGRVDVPMKANVTYHMGPTETATLEEPKPEIAGLRREEQEPVKISMAPQRPSADEAFDSIKVRIGDEDFALNDLPETEAIKEKSWK